MRWLAHLWRVFVGAVCCTALPVSVLAAGWSQRAARRRTLETWYRAGRDSSGASAERFEDFAAADPETRALASWPGWLRAAPPASGWRRAVGSLVANAREGAAVTFNTWVLTLPGCALWLFAWYDGWNNSFTKGYEQAAVGPGTGVLGVVLFIAAMFYVPLGQARQAATGRWRSFYDFSLVGGLVRSNAWACARLGLCYALLSVPVMALKTGPIAFDRFPQYAQLDEAAALALLDQYFFWGGAFVFVAYVWLRLRAARLYATAVVDAVRRGDIAPEQLGATERGALGRLGLLTPEPARPANVIVRVARGAGRTTTRTAAYAATAVVWFAFVAQIFVSEFLNHHAWVGWLNQPLVQLPWFRYVPPGLG